MKTNNECKCSCCTDSRSVLLGKAAAGSQEPNNPRGMTRGEFLKVVGIGILGLSTIPGTKAFAAAEKNDNIKMVQGKNDRMIVDLENKEIRVSTDITKDPSKPSVIDWGRRFQAFFGGYGGKMEKFFVFSTNTVHLIFMNRYFNYHDLGFHPSSWAKRIAAHFTFYSAWITARFTFSNAFF
ncbi:MAG: hypothetical protein KKC76_07480, partial [Proteobacteria bacterium]|nr:hypothetical protein [Pseudomonadota bacterium]